MFIIKNLQCGLEENVSTNEKKVYTRNDVPLIYTHLHVHAIVLCVVVIIVVVVGRTFADLSFFPFITFAFRVLVFSFFHVLRAYYTVIIDTVGIGRIIDIFMRIFFPQPTYIFIYILLCRYYNSPVKNIQTTYKKTSEYVFV